MAVPCMSEKKDDKAKSRMYKENQHSSHNGHSQSRFTLQRPNHLARVPIRFLQIITNVTDKRDRELTDDRLTKRRTPGFK